MEIAEVLKKKILSIKAEGGSAKTIAWYEENINLFILHLIDRGTEPVVQNITIDQAESWFVSQKEKGLSPNTLENRCRCLKAFSNWLYQREYTKVNQLAKLKKPKVVKEDFDIVEIREIQKLLNSIDEKKPQGTRDRAIIALLYETGLRCGEVSNLKIEDLFDGFLRVRAATTKSRKPRNVPIGDKLQRMLVTYVDQYRDNHDVRNNTPTDYLFRSRTGQQLGVHAIETMLYKRCRAAGIRQFSPHKLRHSFATVALESGLPEIILQARLGHSTLQMTAEYTRQVARRELVKKGAVFSLLDHVEIDEAKPRKQRSDKGTKRPNYRKTQPKLRAIK